jgi:hypothetical protein
MKKIADISCARKYQNCESKLNNLTCFMKITQYIAYVSGKNKQKQ